MRLVIFDIDGTLTQTMKADGECFVRSLVEVCGFSDVHTSAFIPPRTASIPRFYDGNGPHRHEPPVPYSTRDANFSG